MSFLAKDCAYARESVSVQLDGELSEFALDRLETHLRICPECATWAEQVRNTTQRLREAGLEAPAHRFMLPRHGRSWRVTSAVALTSAAAVVATMFVSPSGNRASAARFVRIVAFGEHGADLHTALVPARRRQVRRDLRRSST